MSADGGRWPPELEYVALAKWGGWDPERVLEWDEQTADDVKAVMNAEAAEYRVRRGRG
jgi:hypothetical protein